MKRNCIVRILVIAVIATSAILGHSLWNKYIDEKLLMKEALIGATWYQPLEDREKRKSSVERKTLELSEELAVAKLKPFYKDSPGYPNSNYAFDKLWGIKDNSGNVVIQAQYESIDVDIENQYILAGKYDSDVYHYYNFNGSDFIKGDFQDAELFQKGYACVKRDDKYMVIGTDGKVKLEFDCIGLSVYDLERGIFKYLKEEPSDSYLEKPEREGLVDIKGNILLESNYDYIQPYNPCSNSILVGRYSDNQEKYQYLDNNFQEKSKNRYINATIFSDGVAAVEDKAGWHFINENEEIFKDLPNCINVNAFSEGISVVEYKYELKYFNLKGKELFTIPYREETFLENSMAEYQEGYIMFKDNKGKVGYMNRNGKIVVKAYFDQGYPVEDGKASVKAYGRYGILEFPAID